jgi:hypothetical protein
MRGEPCKRIYAYAFGCPAFPQARVDESGLSERWQPLAVVGEEGGHEQARKLESA